MGVDIDRECTSERGLDGDNVARAAASGWVPLAVDAELGSADRHQHVALSIVSAVAIDTRFASR